MEWAKAHYLDASALIKLVDNSRAEAPGRHALRQFYSQHSNMFATSFCFTEALSVFKREFLRGQMSLDAYISRVRDFVSETVESRLKIDEVPILDAILSREAERLVRKYEIDFVDALQVITILHGKFSVLGAHSKSILITTDQELAKAARSEGAEVWECASQPPPV